MKRKIPRTQIPRTALMKLLDDLSEEHIVYIHAPAGFGKTASSLLWLEHREALETVQRAWVSLDEYDNKISEFCKRIVAALSNLQPDNAALRKLAAHDNFNITPTLFTINALNALSRDTVKSVFVIDDIHVVSNEEILKFLPILLKRLSEHCTTLLLSRTAPPDNLSDFISKGEIAVIDAEHLQFSREEIKLLFEKNNRLISAEQAEDILSSTGGWAIGIKALLLSEEELYNIDLTDRYLENFLKTHVWERWDDRLKAFMAKVAVAEELTPELCQWLTKDEKTLRKADADEILAELARENAFLRSVGKGRYRFHDLFREFLMSTLKNQGEEAVTAQWSRGGDYFYRQKDYFRAAEYYLKGKNDDGVAKSILHMYDYYNSPYTSAEQTLSTLRFALYDSVLDKYPYLLEPQTWTAWLDGRADEFEKTLDTYYKLLPKIIIQNPRSVITAIFMRCADYRESFIDTMKTLSKIPFRERFKATSPSLSQIMPFFHRSCRDFSEIAVALEDNVALATKSIGPVIGTDYNVIRECLFAGIQYERGSLKEAHTHALAACANISGGCAAEIKFCAMMILASTLFADGQEADANQVLDNVKNMIEEDKAYYLNANYQAYLSRLRLAQGDESAAEEWLKGNSESLLGNVSFLGVYQHFTTARAHIAMGSYTSAILLLQKLLLLSQRYRRPLDIIESRILLAVAHWKKGRSELSAALEYLEQAFSAASQYEYTQIFVDESASVLPLLKKISAKATRGDYQGLLDPVYANHVYISTYAVSRQRESMMAKAGKKTVKLSKQQKLIVQLLAQGYNREGIVEKTGISLNTVKYHIRLAYEKLGAGGAAEAVMKARELGLVD